MHSKQGVELYQKAVADAKAQGGTVEYGGQVGRVIIQLMRLSATGVWEEHLKKASEEKRLKTRFENTFTYIIKFLKYSFT